MTQADAAGAERARLLATMDHYLDALTAHDTAALRVAPHVRYTENTRALPLGAGLGRTIRGRRPHGQYFTDTARGEVEFWGVADENGADVILGVRLRVEGTLITEIETAAVRGAGGSFFEPDVIVEAYPAFHTALAPEERVSRATLIALANHYFDAIERSDGSRLPVADQCHRWVNGVLDSLMDIRALDDAEAHRALGVAEQMSAGHYAYIEALRARRFPIVDEERGIVVCHLLFDHPGDLPRADGALVFPTPNTMICFEAFKIRRGIIDEVWAIGTALPYGIGSGWQDGPR
jgi:hypothetical protein